MNEYTITVFKPIRIFFTMLVFVISIPVIVFLISRMETLIFKALLPISYLGMTIIFSYFFSFGKLTLFHSKNKISFEWIRCFMFCAKELDSVSISEIKTIVIDKGLFLRRIQLNSRTIEINNIKPVTEDFVKFIEALSKSVIENNGQVIDSPQYLKHKGYYDLTFQFTFVLFIFSIFLLSRLWKMVGAVSLLLLIMPLLAYIIHVRQRIKKNRR